METIYLSKSTYKRLKEFQLPNGTIHTESPIRELYYKGERKLVKEIFRYDKDFHQHKISTLELLDENRELLPTYMYIPDYIISVNNKKVSFTVPYKEGESLERILKNPQISFKEHLYYLKEVGKILEDLRTLRKHPALNEFYIGDFHESNILINRYTNELGLVDLDSCRIGTNYAYTSKYLTPFSILKHFKTKYHHNEVLGNGPGYIIPDENTDIYCYIMMILYYLSDNLIQFVTVEEFYEYLNLLDKAGINQELIYLIEKIITKEDNINPYEYLKTLTEQDIINSREAAKTLIKSKQKR